MSRRTLVRVFAVLTAALAAGAVLLVAEGPLAIQVMAPGGTVAAEPTDIGLLNVAVAALALSLIGWAVLIGLERLTLRGGEIWRWLAIIALTASLAMPLSGSGVSPADRAVLIAMHLVVGAIVITVLYRTSPRRHASSTELSSSDPVRGAS